MLKTLNKVQNYLLPSLQGRGWGVGLLLPSLQGRGWGVCLLLLLLPLCLTSCGDDDDDAIQQPPVPVVTDDTPEYLREGTDVRPATWSVPDYTLYEHTMSVQVQLGDTLAAYQGTGDMMCATIGGEVRAVSTYHETGGQAYFELVIGGDKVGHQVSLSYYCDRLHRIYTISNWATFTPSAAPTGDDGIYRPMFSEHD